MELNSWLKILGNVYIISPIDKTYMAADFKVSTKPSWLCSCWRRGMSLFSIVSIIVCFQMGMTQVLKELISWKRTIEGKEESSCAGCQLWTDHWYKCPQIRGSLHEYDEYAGLCGLMWTRRSWVSDWWGKLNIIRVISYIMEITQRYTVQSLEICLDSEVWRSDQRIA